MPILRHEHKTNYTVVPNALLYDDRLTLRDIGLLCLMLSLPDDWKFSVRGMRSIVPNDGRDCIAASLKRLKDAGYVQMERQWDNGKLGTVIWTVSDVALPCPEKPCPENPDKAPRPDLPCPEKPCPGFPYPGNPDDIQVSNIPSKKEPSTQSLSLTRAREGFVPPSLEEVEDYCRQRGNDVDPRQFFDYFAAGDWMDRDGKPVRNWKQRIISWERQGGRNGSHREKDHGQISGRKPEREYKVIYD